VLLYSGYTKRHIRKERMLLLIQEITSNVSVVAPDPKQACMWLYIGVLSNNDEIKVGKQLNNSLISLS
jgi:hypothetical protein